MRGRGFVRAVREPCAVESMLVSPPAVLHFRVLNASMGCEVAIVLLGLCLCFRVLWACVASWCLRCELPVCASNLPPTTLILPSHILQHSYNRLCRPPQTVPHAPLSQRHLLLLHVSRSDYAQQRQLSDADAAANRSGCASAGRYELMPMFHG